MPVERLRVECIRCLLKGHLERYPEGTEESQKLDYMQKLMQIIGRASRDMSAPVITEQIIRLQKEMFGIENEYGEIKRHFNEVMFGYEPVVSERIAKAEDPVLAGLQYAMIGNYIDYGAMEHVDENYLTELLNTAGDKQVSEEIFHQLKTELEKAKKLLYLTDNCGEVVMDKLWIEQLIRNYPQLEITVMVRGAAVINDATMEDAEQIGLTKLVKVTDNGTGIAGTCLEQLPQRALAEADAADVIIAKGQGNYESLRGCGRNIFYLFLCKCEMFAENFGVPRMTGMLVRESGNLFIHKGEDYGNHEFI